MKAFLQEVAEDLTTKFGADLQHCAIVFNNKRPADYLKKYLADIYKKPFWSPDFFTVQEFFKESSTLQIADTHTQLFTLYDSYIELLKNEKALNLPSIAKFQGIAQIILGDFAQIDMELVATDKVFSALEDIAVINERFDFLTDEQKQFLSQFWTSYNDGRQKQLQQRFIEMWRRMPQLYTRFHQQLAEKGLITSARLYRNLAEEMHDLPEFTQPYRQGKIVFIGFNALSKSEETIFKRLQEQGEAIFYFDTDTYYLDDEMQEAGLFIRRNLKQLGLANQLDNERSFIKAQPRNVNVYKIQGETAQAKVVDAILKEQYPVLAEEQDMSSTAIILANENLLIPVLQTIPAKTGDKKIPLNVTMGIPLSASTLFGLAEIWLDTQVQYRAGKLHGQKTIQHKTVEAFISHPLIGISDKLKETIYDALVDLQLVEVPLEKMLQFKGLFALFFTEVEQLEDYVKGLVTVFEYVLRRELATKRLKEIEAHLFLSAIKELNRLHDNLQYHVQRYATEQLDISFVSSLILKSLQNVSAPLEGESTRGLQLMGLLESRNLNFSHVLMLGVNEGIVPKGSTSPTFIPESLRKAYGLPILEYQDAISAYIFYRLLQRAEKIDLIYNSSTDEQNTGEKSRFIAQLAYESSFNFVEKELQLPVVTEVHEELKIAKTAKIQQELNQYLTGKRILSATALTTYISNPIDFFYKYIAKIDEPEKVEEAVEADKLGIILHDVMELFYRELKDIDPDITAERIEDKKNDIDRLIYEAFIRRVYGHSTEEIAYTGMQKVIVAIIKEYISIILEEDIANAPFAIIELEDKGTAGHTFTMNDGTEKTIKLFGIVDRFEQKDGVYKLIDYKTGGDSLQFSTLENCFKTDENQLNKALVQTLFYTYVLEQRYRVSDVEVNLYVVRNMRKEGVLFKTKENDLTGETLANAKEEFITQLNDKLKELFDYDIPFRVSIRPENYQYSIYKTLFNG